MTSEDLQRRHHHLMMDHPGVFCLATYNQPTNRQPSFHFHVQEPRSHGNLLKDETDLQLLREIGQQLAGIGDEVNSRYSINNNSTGEAHFSISFNVTFHLLPYFRVAMEMITRRRTATSINTSNNNTTTNNNNNNTSTNNSNNNYYSSSQR